MLPRNLCATLNNRRGEQVFLKASVLFKSVWVAEKARRERRGDVADCLKALLHLFGFRSLDRVVSPVTKPRSLD